MWVVSFWVGLRVSFWLVSASLLEGVGSGRYQSKTISGTKNVSYDA
jgi:hypothetical protein